MLKTRTKNSEHFSIVNMNEICCAYLIPKHKKSTQQYKLHPLDSKRIPSGFRSWASRNRKSFFSKSASQTNQLVCKLGVSRKRRCISMIKSCKATCNWIDSIGKENNQKLARELNNISKKCQNLEQFQYGIFSQIVNNE